MQILKSKISKNLNELDEYKMSWTNEKKSCNKRRVFQIKQSKKNQREKRKYFFKRENNFSKLPNKLKFYIIEHKKNW